MLVLSTLPALRITWNGVPVPGIGHGKPAALLAYLALQPGPHSREALADLFWPELGAGAARQNLRQSLFLLRDTLPTHSGLSFIAASRQHVAFDGDAPYQVDALAFGMNLPACATPAPAECTACIERMQTAITLYRGPLLADFALPDCPDFDLWLQVKRESLHRRALDLLARLADCHERMRNFHAALTFAHRYVELEPWSEEGYARTMRLYAQNGQHEAALGEYERCTEVLERELGALPGPETRTMLARVRNREFAPPTARSAAALPMEERRQVTVMYCELHAPGIDDPEDALDILKAPQALGLEIAHRSGGHVMQAHGGGLLVYFGYPDAVENSALFAIRAALQIAAEATRALDIRIGVHSGIIVTGGDAQIPDPIGMTSSLAIRLRELAQSGEVIVSVASQQRAAGYFNFAALGPRKLRGIQQAKAAFKVMGVSGATHRLTANARQTPFIGREDELASLLKVWSEAQQGDFRALLVSGEAGIGKSRLVAEFTKRLNSGAGFVRELRCFPESQRSPLHPVIDLYASLCDFAMRDTTAEKLSKLETFLRMRAPQFAERGLPLLAHMLGLSEQGGETAPDRSAENMAKDLRRLLVDLLYVLAARQPVVLLAKDLHWVDDSTRAVLEQLFAHRKPAPIMILMSARPEWSADWPGLNKLMLQPMPARTIARLAGSLDGSLSPARMAGIVARADGIPLFAEELALLDQVNEMPANVHDLLAVRLDGLGTAKAMAQLAATLGREFDMAFLSQTGGLAQDELAAALAMLEASGLVQELSGEQWQFKHALMQEAAYLSQTRDLRMAAHHRIALMLEKGYRNIASVQPEVLARHWGEAGEALKAAHQWLAAGLRAASNFAHREAVSSYEAGLSAIAALPPAHQERDRLEFRLLLNLARSEQFISGYGQQRSQTLLLRALEIEQRMDGAVTDVFEALAGLWEGASSRAGHHEAIKIGQQLLAIARNADDRMLLQQAHYALGSSLYWHGDFTLSRDHLEQCIALEEIDAASPTCNCYGHYMRINATVYLALVLWLQGEAVSAFAKLAESRTQAKARNSPHALVMVLLTSMIMYRWQGEVDELARIAGEAGELRARIPSLLLDAFRQASFGWVAAMRGERAGLDLLEQGVETARLALNGVAISTLAPYIEALLHMGETGKALKMLEEAQRHAHNKQDFHFMAELHRMRGMSRLMQDDYEGARECFSAALTISEAQGATAWTARAAKSLASLPGQAN